MIKSDSKAKKLSALEVDRLCALAKAAARGAGARVLLHYNTKQNQSFSLKRDDSEVTLADLESHDIIMSHLRSTDIPILSEEGDNHSISQGLLWVIDPLDGTKDFINREEGFCVMIGLLYNLKPILGVVYQPLTKKTFYAIDGCGSFCDEEDGSAHKLKVSDEDDPSCVRLILSKNHFAPRDKAFTEFLHNSNFVRQGSIGIKWSLIAENKADAYFNFDGLKIWDVVAPYVILKEAGGAIYNVKGEELEFSQVSFSKGIVACNSSCSQALKGKVQSFLKEVLVKKE